jgi:hypothetical protein
MMDLIQKFLELNPSREYEFNIEIGDEPGMFFALLYWFAPGEDIETVTGEGPSVAEAVEKAIRAAKDSDPNIVWE